MELNPDGYDHIFIGDRKIDFPKGKENLIDRLKSQFPHEAKGIDAYFATLTNMMQSLRNVGRLNKPLQAAMSVPAILKWMRATGADLIAHEDRNVVDGRFAHAASKNAVCLSVRVKSTISRFPSEELRPCGHFDGSRGKCGKCGK